MCEYCGCLALDAIAELTAEHDVVVNLAGEVRRALGVGDRETAAERCRTIAAMLEPHTAVEEGALFPAMAVEYGEHVAALRKDHLLITAVLAESTDGVPTDIGWPGRVEHALHVLREHIAKEQDGVFPAALALLGPDEWDRLDAVRTEVGSAIHAGA